jgi:hypothetical protein
VIDSVSEQLITLPQAARLVPSEGGSVTLQTLYRWTTHGIRNIKLEYIQAGGKRCTSREAMARFFARLTSREITIPPHQKQLQKDKSSAITFINSMRKRQLTKDYVTR